MLIWRSLYICLSLALYVSARGISSLPSAACTYAVSNATGMSINCNSPFFVGSVVLCIEEYASNRSQITRAYKYLQEVCEYQLKRKLDPNELDDHLRNATKYMNNRFPLEYIPTQVSKELYSLSYSSVDNLISERKKGTTYGLLLFAYWCLLLLISILVNVFQWCFPLLSSDIKQYKVSRWIRREFFTAISTNKEPLKKRYLLQRMKLSFIRHLPLRIHIAILSLYAILVVVLCSVNYNIHTPNIVFRCMKGQRLVWVADRTGIIATIQLPIIYLFSSRGNIVSSFSCFSYKTFNILHKWIARITWILLCIHALCYLGFATTKGDYIARWGLVKWRFANIGMISVSLTILFAILRKKFYEFFKATHKLLIILFTVGVWYHCISLGWIEYLYVCIAIWAHDYLTRIGKIISSGGILKAKCSCIYETKITSKGYENIPHTIRLEVNYSSWWRQYPGTYTWIYFLAPGLFWQAHPFTLLSPSTDENYNQLIFNIRVKNGLTKSLGNMLIKKPNYEMTIPVLIEGPYGSTRPYKSYQQIFFIAGGVGFTPLFSIAADLSKYFQGETSRDGIKRNITIKWICPDFETVSSFKHELTHISRFSNNIQMNIFISRYHELEMVNIKKDYTSIMDEEGPKEIGSIEWSHRPTAVPAPFSASDRSAQEPMSSHREQLKSQHIFINQLLEGAFECISLQLNSRPHVGKLVKIMVTDLSGPAAVIACGPQSMCMSARTAAAECLTKEYSNRVDYYEEDLLW